MFKKEGFSTELLHRSTKVTTEVEGPQKNRRILIREWSPRPSEGWDLSLGYPMLPSECGFSKGEYCLKMDDLT